MVAQSTQAPVAELTEREIECGRRLAAAMFGLGKQQAFFARKHTAVLIGQHLLQRTSQLRRQISSDVAPAQVSQICRINRCWLDSVHFL